MNNNNNQRFKEQKTSTPNSQFIIRSNEQLRPNSGAGGRRFVSYCGCALGPSPARGGAGSGRACGGDAST
jgi:hypothetical protein